MIYSIPTSFPLYYVTYVQVYGATGTVVYVGYTPGYYGVDVTPYGTVVYGTGYAYPAGVGTVYYPPPTTYGYGATMGYTPYTGWAIMFAAGYAVGHSDYYYGYAYLSVLRVRLQSLLWPRLWGIRRRGGVRSRRLRRPPPAMSIINTAPRAR